MSFPLEKLHLIPDFIRTTQIFIPLRNFKYSNLFLISYTRARNKELSMDMTCLDSITEDKKNYISLRKGENLYRQGSPCAGIHVIISGLFKIYSNEDNGKEIIHRLASSEDILGVNSYFGPSHYLENANALEDSICCFIHEKHLMELMGTDPAFALQIMKKLVVDLNSSYSRNANLIKKSVRERLADYFIYMSSRFAEESEIGLRVKYQLSREEIASIIGTANETVSRGITEFKELGYLDEKDKHFFILKHEKLKQIGKMREEAGLTNVRFLN